MTEEAPLNSQSYLLDKETIQAIAKTAQRVDHLADLMTSTMQKLDKIGDAVGGLKTDVAVCLSQREQIKELQDDVEQVQIESANLKGRIAMIAILFGTIAGWIGNILPSLFTRGS